MRETTRALHGAVSSHGAVRLFAGLFTELHRTLRFFDESNLTLPHLKIQLCTIPHRRIVKKQNPQHRVRSESRGTAVSYCGH